MEIHAIIIENGKVYEIDFSTDKSFPDYKNGDEIVINDLKVHKSKDTVDEIGAYRTFDEFLANKYPSDLQKKFRQFMNKYKDRIWFHINKTFLYSIPKLGD